MNSSPVPETPRPHQGDDLDPKLILRVAMIFVLGIIISLGGTAWLFHRLHETYPNRTSEAEPRVSAADLPPLPRPQIAPVLDLETVRAAEDRHLAGYAWIDRQHGVAQIPIDRAMTLWVQTQDAMAATHPAPATNAAPAAQTELQMRQDKAKEAAHAP